MPALSTAVPPCRCNSSLNSVVFLNSVSRRNHLNIKLDPIAHEIIRSSELCQSRNFFAFYVYAHHSHLNALFEPRKMPRKDQLATTSRRNRRSRPILRPCILRMIYDMIVSKRLTVAEMADVAECDEESITEIRNFLQILAFREDGNSPSPSPTVNINILPADSSPAPSISISATRQAVNVYVTSNITVSVSTDGAIRQA